LAIERWGGPVPSWHLGRSVGISLDHFAVDRNASPEQLTNLTVSLKQTRVREKSHKDFPTPRKVYESKQLSAVRIS
jgi:hypothetical protein